MLQITRIDGKTTSHAVCDECGNGWKWEGNLSFSRMEHILQQKGWMMGKRHTCETCKNLNLNSKVTTP